MAVPWATSKRRKWPQIRPPALAQARRAAQWIIWVKPYRLSPLAESDLEEIWLYTLKNWSIEQADAYLNSLVAAFEGLAAGTKRGRPADVLPEFQKYMCGAHVVYFLDYADCLDVIRVLHQRQDAARHL